MRPLVLAALFCVFSAPAIADIPAELDAALSRETEPRSPLRIERRMTVGEASVRFEERSDADGEPVYTLLEPSETDLTDAQREIWDEAREPDEPETGVEAEDGESVSVSISGMAALREMLGGEAAFEGVRDGVDIYAFTPASMPGAYETPGAMLEVLRGEIGVDPETGGVVHFRLYISEAFKPNIAARIDSFDLIQRFVHDPELNGPLRLTCA